MIVGDVARQRPVSNWFTSRPMFGRTVLVTRPGHQADELSRQLRNLGAHVLVQPAIEIAAPRDWAPVDAIISRLPEFDWLVFSSSNGVEYFFRRLFELGHDIRSLHHVGLAAIGPATDEALAQYHLHADVRPKDRYRAEALAEALGPRVGGKRVLLARASRGRELLADMLSAAGATVEQAVVYESRDITTPDDEIVRSLANDRIDWITVTSSAIAQSLASLFGATLHKTRLVAISPLTAETLTGLGYPPAAVAQTYTSSGIVEAILSVERGKD
jgi:uroporphyrinogen III methyltransferase/synthase